MRMGQTLFRYLLIFILAISNTSCTTTQALHNNRSTHTEKIKSFLIAQDKRTLAIAGEEYHFIFPLNEPLKSALEWPERGKLNPTFGDFTATANQKIKGSYQLGANISQLSAQEQQFLISHGFRRQGDLLVHDATIQGTYYRAGNVKLPQTAYFRQPYTVTVIFPDSPADTAVKAALTPLALAADGITVVLGSIVYIPIWLILLQEPSLK